MSTDSTRVSIVACSVSCSSVIRPGISEPCIRTEKAGFSQLKAISGSRMASSIRSSGSSIWLCAKAAP